MTHARLATIAAAVALSACSGSTVQETLGLERQAPDEFRVVSRPPLSVPPQFALRPPSATAASPAASPADAQARSLVTGAPIDTAPAQNNVFILKPGNADTAVAPVTATGGTSSVSPPSAEAQFLKKAGADQANPNVREEIVQERFTRVEQQAEESWWDILSTNPEKKDPTVNAPKEAERLEKNEEEGKPVTEGETPQEGARDTGILGRILGY